MDNPLAIPKIVINCRPCAGKTTSMAKLLKRLAAHGRIPILVPEAATLLISRGVNPPLLPGVLFEDVVLSEQINIEDLLQSAVSHMHGELTPVML
jgi:hypothetical protein